MCQPCALALGETWLTYLCVCAYIWESEESSQESILPFRVGPKGPAHVFGLGGKPLLPLSHLCLLVLETEGHSGALAGLALSM